MKYLFFDIDGTIFDFDICERNSLIKAFEEHGISFSETIMKEYHEINLKLWEKHNKGLITREKLSVERFETLFDKFEITVSPSDFAKTFRKYLNTFWAYIEGAKELLDDLKNRYELYAVTNGVAITQHTRLNDSGLNKVFKQIFISEEIGVQKPEKAFFDYCFERIENFDKNEAIIIGDSLSSDIKGGNNAGIKTCWFNRDFSKNTENVHIDYEISKISQVYEVLGEKE